MGILESVQHGLEKASQQASYIAKMQHLHTVINDLTYKSSLDHQALATKTMELFKAGHLTQSELLPMCQELDNYLQQIDEVQGELKKMQDNPPAGHTAQPGAPAAPPQGYLAYPPQGAPAPPQGYPPYPPPPQGYVAYPPGPPQGYPGYPGYPPPPPQGYPGYPPGPPQGYPAYPGTPAAAPADASAAPAAPTQRVPTQPLGAPGSSAPATPDAATPEAAPH